MVAENFLLGEKPGHCLKISARFPRLPDQIKQIFNCWLALTLKVRSLASKYEIIPLISTIYLPVTEFVYSRAHMPWTWRTSVIIFIVFRYEIDIMKNKAFEGTVFQGLFKANIHEFSSVERMHIGLLTDEGNIFGNDSWIEKERYASCNISDLDWIL